MESYLRQKMATLRSRKAMPRPTLDDPFTCYLEGIDRMIVKHVPGAYRTFKAHGPIKFGDHLLTTTIRARHAISQVGLAQRKIQTQERAGIKVKLMTTTGLMVAESSFHPTPSS
jgi:hypothetical protein